MSNETVIIQQSQLFLMVGTERLTALPSTGTIASMEKLDAEAAYIGGLHNTSALVISGSNGYRFTVNVLAHSADDSFLYTAIDLIRSTGKILAVSLTYKNTAFVSGSCAIETRAVRNFNADTAEFIAYPFIGNFQVARVGRFSNPATLNADEIKAAMPAAV